MKHLKTYKVFESSGNSIKNLIEDSLIDMSDDYILVKVTTDEDDELIDIEISNEGKYFDITKYLDCFEVLNSIIESEGYDCSLLNVYIRACIHIPGAPGILQDKDFKTINNLLNPQNVTSEFFKWSNWEVSRIFIELEKETK